jgi:hypothetical protein
MLEAQTMAKSLAASIIELLDSDKVDVRAAAATVLAAVGKGDKSIESALANRLSDADVVVRRIALQGLAAMGAAGNAAQLVPLLHDHDQDVAQQAARMLGDQGAAAESVLRKEVSIGVIAVRRVVAQLLLRRGTTPALEAVIDQFADREFGEQALQLVRTQVDEGVEKSIALVEKVMVPRLTETSKALQKAFIKAVKIAQTANQEVAKAGAKNKKQKQVAPSVAISTGTDPLRDPDVADGIASLSAYLRLVGYLAKPSTISLLLAHAGEDRPRPIRLAAIAGLRRLVAQSEAKGTESVIAALIEFADGDDAVVAQSAVDTLRGARIPDKLAKPFAALAKSQYGAAQKLAMERMPAGGGASAIKALVDALAGTDAAARDAAARGLAKAPEAALPLVRALVACKDEAVARRYAASIRSHRGHLSKLAIEELVATLRTYMEASAKGKANADSLLLERVFGELIADVSPAHHVEMLFERARRLRKLGKSVEAFGSLKPLIRSRADLDAAIDDDSRYFLALLYLEAAGEGMVRSANADDPVLGQFSMLASKGYPLAKKLAKEKGVSDEALYALGFRLLESKDSNNEELGAEVLQGIVAERPRSKLAKNAKNKLKLSGYGD